MAKILPSILCADPLYLARDVAELAAGGVEMLHVDVMDGHFVPNLAIGFHVIEALAKGTDLRLDVHLMLSEPAKYIPRLAGLCYAVSFHWEAVDNPIEIVKQIQAMGCKAGIAVKPGTNATALRDVLLHIDYALCMTVEPGFAGQSFIASALGNLDALRCLRSEMGLSFILEVDGSINAENAGICVNRGAEWLVCGASLFSKNKTITKSLQDIQSVI